VQQRKILFLRIGHRTILFQPSKVFDALEKFEVREAGRSRQK
jgi:hypothetical protein